MRNADEQAGPSQADNAAAAAAGSAGLGKQAAAQAPGSAGKRAAAGPAAGAAAGKKLRKAGKAEG